MIEAYSRMLIISNSRGKFLSLGFHSLFPPSPIVFSFYSCSFSEHKESSSSITSSLTDQAVSSSLNTSSHVLSPNSWNTSCDFTYSSCIDSGNELGNSSVVRSNILQPAESHQHQQLAKADVSINIGSPPLMAVVPGYTLKKRSMLLENGMNEPTLQVRLRVSFFFMLLSKMMIFQKDLGSDTLSTQPRSEDDFLEKRIHFSFISVQFIPLPLSLCLRLMLKDVDCDQKRQKPLLMGSLSKDSSNSPKRKVFPFCHIFNILSHEPESFCFFPLVLLFIFL